MGHEVKALFNTSSTHNILRLLWNLLWGFVGFSVFFYFIPYRLPIFFLTKSANTKYIISSPYGKIGKVQRDSYFFFLRNRLPFHVLKLQFPLCLFKHPFIHICRVDIHFYSVHLTRERFIHQRILKSVTFSNTSELWIAHIYTLWLNLDEGRDERTNIGTSTVYRRHIGFKIRGLKSQFLNRCHIGTCINIWQVEPTTTVRLSKLSKYLIPKHHLKFEEVNL